MHIISYPVRGLVLYSMYIISYPVRGFVFVLYAYYFVSGTRFYVVSGTSLQLCTVRIVNNFYYVCRVPRGCIRSWAPTKSTASCR